MFCGLRRSEAAEREPLMGTGFYYNDDAEGDRFPSWEGRAVKFDVFALKGQLILARSETLGDATV